jgi:hypothetical protein
MSAGNGSGFGGGVGFSVPLNLNQTPVSRTGATTAGGSSTGAFFSRVPATEFQGAHNLLTGGVSASAGGLGTVAIAAAFVAFAVLLGGGRK